jgi:hypothetical protein
MNYEQIENYLNGTSNSFSSLKSDIKETIAFDRTTYLAIRHGMQAVVTIIAVFGILANAFVLIVMLKTKKIRENKTNDFILAILSFNFLFALWFAFFLVRNPKKTELVHTGLENWPSLNLPRSIQKHHFPLV